MRHLQTCIIILAILTLGIISTHEVKSQNLVEFDGPTHIEFNSTSGLPHLRLVEDDTSPGGSTRLEFGNSMNVGEKFEIRSYLHPSTLPRIAWYYNSNVLMAYNVNDDGLGIGTSSSGIGAKLHVKSTSSSSFPILLMEEEVDNEFTRLFFKNTTNATDRFALSANLGNSTDHRMGFFYNGEPRVVYNENHKGLGIGTSNPDEILHLLFTGADGIKIDGDGTGDARVWIDNDAGSHYLFDDISDANALGLSSSNAFKINTNGSERLRIAETGEVSINAATNTSRKFILETDDKLYGMEVINDNTDVAVGIGGVVQSTGTTNKFGVRGSCEGSAGTGFTCGLFGLSSTIPSNSYAVYANGDLHYLGTLTSGSDIKLKKDIQDIGPVLDRVLQLNSKSYSYKQSEYPHMNLASGKQIGFIAQEVREVFPELVEDSFFPKDMNDENGTSADVEFLGLKYMEMIPILTQAIQEQQEIIESMKLEIQALKERDE